VHIGKSYKLPEFLAWTRRTIYILVVLSVMPVVLYKLLGFKWVAIPWGIVFLLGATVALSAGFKNAQAYNRLQEAQQVWASIVSYSRAWGLMCRDYVADQERARQLVYRHLAWLTALRHQMREVKPWESMERAENVEYQRRYAIPEREHTLESDLTRYISSAESEQVLASHSRAMQVIALQNKDLCRLFADGNLTASQFGDLQSTVRQLIDQQSRSERIKNFPFPRQHAFVNSLFVRILCVLLPFSMLGEFEHLNEFVDGWAKGNMVWLSVPLSLLILWMYTSLDQVGESTDNPFEGGANDVPISMICEEIETELREMLGEANVPAPAHRDSDIVV
jgi:putative membrane protein